MITSPNHKLFAIATMLSILLLGVSALSFSFLYPGTVVPIDKLRYNVCKVTIEKVDNAETEQLERGGGRSKRYTQNAISFEELKEYLKELKPGTIMVTSHGKSVCALIPGIWKHTMIYLGNQQQVKSYFDENSVLYKTIEPYFVTGDEYLMIDASFKEDVTIRCISKMANLREESTLKVFLCFEPQFDKQKNLNYISKAFEELGKEYDLSFDDFDDTELYCTEFINNSLAGFKITFNQFSSYLNRTITLPNDMVNSIVEEYIDDEFSFKLCIRKEQEEIKRLELGELANFPKEHWMN